MASKTKFKIITKRLATKNKVPYYKEVIEHFTTREAAEKKLNALVIKQENYIALVDELSGIKTVFYKSLGAHSYSKKEFKL